MPKQCLSKFRRYRVGEAPESINIGRFISVLICMSQNRLVLGIVEKGANNGWIFRDVIVHHDDAFHDPWGFTHYKTELSTMRRAVERDVLEIKGLELHAFACMVPLINYVDERVHGTRCKYAILTEDWKKCENGFLKVL